MDPYMNMQWLLVVFTVLSLSVVNSEDCYCLQKLVSGISDPIFVEHDSVNERYYVADQSGVVHIYTEDWQRELVPLVNLTNDVHTSSRLYDERGLLSIALHPQFSSNKYLFAYSIRLFNGQEYAVVSRHRVGTVPPEEDILLVVEQHHHLRNGGQVLFGKDGKLLISVGDGGLFDRTNISLAQNRSSLLGKILRIDVDNSDIVGNHRLLYSIPKDNPFLDQADTKNEIYALGARNMWRCSVDIVTDSMFCGDTGDKQLEEINMIQKGKNYGWNIFEGSTQVVNDTSTTKWDHEPPIYEYQHGEMGHAVVGGYVYRGQQFKHLYGRYIFGDFVSGKIFFKNLAKKSSSTKELRACENSICPCHARDKKGLFLLSFSSDTDGELFVLIQGNGEIFKLIPPLRNMTTCRSRRHQLSSSIFYAVLIFFFLSNIL